MWEQIEANKRTSQYLIVGMFVFLLALGYLAGILMIDNSPGGGLLGAGLGTVIWLILFLIGQIGGESILLSIGGAREIGKEDHPQLYNIVEEMQIASGLSAMPRVYIIEDPSPNAFATGLKQEKAAVAVTTGLLERLNRSELQGVIAHEIGHILNRDTYLMLVASTMIGAIGLISELVFRSSLYGGRTRSSSREGNSPGGGLMVVIGILLMILAPIAARVLYFAISRKREYLADASAVQFTRHPEGLAQALMKISGVTEPPLQMTSTTAPMYIHNPSSELFATHPPIEKRIQVLMTLAAGANGRDEDFSYENYARAFTQTNGRENPLWKDVPTSSTDLVSSLPALQEEHLAQEKPIMTRLERKRAVTHTTWNLNDYLVIDCECKTRLRIPTAYHHKKLQCPYCGEVHTATPERL